MDKFLLSFLALAAVVISDVAMVENDSAMKTSVGYRNSANPQMTFDNRQKTRETELKEIQEVLRMADDKMKAAITDFHDLESPLKSVEDMQEVYRDFLIWNATKEKMSRNEFLHQNRQAHELGKTQSGFGSPRLIKCLISSEQISKPTVKVMYCFGSCYVKYSLGGLFVQMGCTKDKHSSTIIFEPYKVVIYCNENLCNKPEKDDMVPTISAQIHSHNSVTSKE